MFVCLLLCCFKFDLTLRLVCNSRYAGVLMGITNSFATIPGIVSPYVTGWITNNEVAITQKHMILLIGAS